MINSQIQTLIDNLPETTQCDLYWQFHHNYYIERPVDIKTFIFDENFLGKVFVSQGKCNIFDYWLKLLYEIYPNPFYRPYKEVIMSCAIGVGKSTVTNISMLYELYCLLCMKNPASFFGLMPSDTIVLAIFSSTKENVSDVNWKKMKEAIITSPWFRKRLQLDELEPKIKSLDLTKNIAIQLGSRYQHAIGRDVLIAVVDEGNNKVISDQAKINYMELTRRRESRFKDGFSVPGIIWLVSSPKTTDDFLNERIKLSQNDPAVKIIDNLPTWIVKENVAGYSGKKFNLFLGDDDHDPRILLNTEKITSFPIGSIISVPIEHYNEFSEDKDILGAIRDIAGYRVQFSTTLFKSKELVNRVFSRDNLFNKDIIYLATNNICRDIIEQININMFKAKLKIRNKRYIHMDFGYNNDMFGIAATYAINASNVNERELDTLTESYDAMLSRRFIVDWAVAFKATDKHGVPTQAIVQFIKFLRKQGYPIATVSADRPGIILLQDLHIDNFDTKYVSVDTSRIPYLTLKQKIYEGVVTGCNNKHLINELCNLQDNSIKVDHTSTGSKDCADAVAGSFIQAYTNPVSVDALSFAEEFSTNYSSYSEEFYNSNTGLHNYF